MSMFEDNFVLVSPPENEDEHNSESETSREELEMWCYRDPVGKIQGPFPSAKMLRWRNFFHRHTTVWRYGSEKEISFENFLRIHKRNPLWIYFDEEDEPLIQEPVQDPSEHSDSDNERYFEEYEDVMTSTPIERPNGNNTATANGEKVNQEKEANSQKKSSSGKQDNESKEAKEIENETKEFDAQQRNDISDDDESSGIMENTQADSDDSDSSQTHEKCSGYRDVGIDIEMNDNGPDVYKKLAALQKVTPTNPLNYIPYKNDKKNNVDEISGKENKEPLDSSQLLPEMNFGLRSGELYWDGRQWIPRHVPLPYYMYMPPPPRQPLPYYISTPPPHMMFPPMRPMGPPPQSEPYRALNMLPQQYFGGQDLRAHNSYGRPPNYHLPLQSATGNPSPQRSQPNIVEEIYQAYRESHPNNKDNNMGEFSENPIQTRMNFTTKKLQQLHTENQKLKMSNEQLKTAKKDIPKAVEYNKDISFAKMVSMNKDGGMNGGDKRSEIKSFWETVPQPPSAKAPVKKTNKYPVGYVGESTKVKKKEVAKVHKDGVEEFSEWCLNTLNYISENKLNIEGLRVVLNEMETIASVERYIKMWLDDFNPKLWQLFNEKLRKYRKKGNDELSTPARANPCDAEKQKQKEKLQKKAEFFAQNKDLNTANINRHLTKIQQHSKK
ncbi:uncharacterized protein LOC132257798 [Phlebotomus argentipes]|uniref:uncharacterized protein LOC132257798 n=1 Tax=Phlebotomus argentipes TaxID=94469 RepID=UPI0028931C5F|nr:uncharacterized protein LOC132257798 [Phlebotomus argentipes]XP_059610813.1 uncharacterized protein LOC132257798 [Phlebotomus argentipes]XP_059610815.1 uncharacterized protein LOC132257798 [Phlebotomus argentipes]